MIRRIVDAAILLGGAVIFTFVRGKQQPVWINLGVNLVAAGIALGILHVRWRAREKREITPSKAEDIFS
ncbi:MAG: hypothetical protein ACKO1N_06195 [Erythrobacter sp.]